MANLKVQNVQGKHLSTYVDSPPQLTEPFNLNASYRKGCYFLRGFPKRQSLLVGKH